MKGHEGDAMEKLEQLNTVVWWDTTMNARDWLAMANVNPHEAAMLLCCLNPLGRPALDPETTYVDGDTSSPERYRVLLRAFDDVANTLPQYRTLIDWLAIAQKRGLRYHRWIDEYMKCLGNSSPAVYSTGIDLVKSNQPLQRQRFQEQEILRVLTEKGYEAKALPTRAAGKSGAKAEVRGQLRFTVSVFNKAWDRLRQSGEIADAD